MSQPQPPGPAKLVIGLFMKDRQLAGPLSNKLAGLFGAVDMVSPWFPFDYTSYYEPEMGSPLFRRMFVFKTLINQEALAGIKIRTNELETEYTSGGKRQINIDPGYMLHERFVLATGKNFTHRIYIGKGIYADLTLIYQKGSFRELPWTYPDYSDSRMLAFLGRVRKKFNEDVRVL